MWKPDEFRSQLAQANGEIPVTLAVATKLGKDTQHLRPDGTPKWFARTEGLNAFGVMEVEWRAFDGEFLKLASWIYGIASHLINDGPIVANDYSMGSDAAGAMPRITIRQEPSTTGPGSWAYAVYPQRVM
jgi:hypothetical protein